MISLHGPGQRAPLSPKCAQPVGAGAGRVLRSTQGKPSCPLLHTSMLSSNAHGTVFTCRVSIFLRSGSSQNTL